VGAGAWTPLIPWGPHIPVSAANLPDGRLLTFAGDGRTTWDGSDSRFSYAAVWDPKTGAFVESNNGLHDMFCGGITSMTDGRVLVNGGDSCNGSTSIFDWRTNRWTSVSFMNDTRWYNPSVTLPDGGVFTVTGSGTGGATAERWDSASGWRRLTGIPWGNVTAEPGFQTNWHPFVVLAPNGRLFHFGPTDVMHWVDPTGNGSLTNSGQNVPGALFPKEGAWAVYEEGKVLVTGGAINNTAKNTSTVSRQTYIVDLNPTIPTVTPAASMAFARFFANSVVLPNGEVMIIGGNSDGKGFSDTNPVLTPELWNPRTGTWRTLANIAVPRSYHSAALLLADGRVWSGGGGLNGGDHQDAQVFTPPALLKADGSPATRPVIANTASTIGYGQTFSVAATPGLTQFAFIRLSSLTHSVNTDLRRLVLPSTEVSAGSYQLTSHGNRNVMTPGYWMLFGLNPQGVYSEAKIVLVTTQNTLWLAAPADQNTAANQPVDLPLQSFVPGSAVPIFSATNLPPGLAINAATGRITGTPTASGIFRPSVSLTASGQTVNATFTWTVLVTDLGTGTLTREVWSNISGVTVASLTGIAAYPANPTSRGTVTSFEAPTNFADNYGQRIRGYIYAPLTGDYRFSFASDDSGQLSLSTDAAPANARVIASVAGYTAPREWTRYSSQTSALIRLQAGQRYYVEALSKDGGGGDHLAVGWTIPGATGVSIITSAYLSVNSPPTIASPGTLAHAAGENVSIPLLASDPEGDALTFTATGLPPGLSISPNVAVISGAPTRSGSYAVTVTANDGAVASSVTFTWTIRDALTLPPLTGTPLPGGQAVALSIIGSGGANTRYTWNFGDGTPDSAWSPSGSLAHTFPAPGRYIVTVTAQDDTGRVVSSSFWQVIHAPLTARRPTASSALAYVPAATGNARLWVANPDADTVTVLDAVTGAKVGGIPVPASPRCVALAPDGRVWITSADGAAISIVNPGALTIAQTIVLPRGSRPFGLAFAPTGGSAWVTLEATGQLVRLDAATGAITRTIEVGPNPRHLSITADAARVLVSRFITPLLPGESTATIDTTGRGGEVLVVDAAAGTIVKTAILQHSEAIESQSSARGIPNYLAAPVISPDGLSAWIPSKQDNIKRGQLREGTDLTHDGSIRAIASKLVLPAATEDSAARVDFDNSGVPSAAVFDPFGGYLFVALEANRQVAVVDVWNASNVAHFNVGRAPQAVALSPDGRTLYVQNFMDRSVSILDVSVFQQGRVATPPLIATTTTVATEKLPAPVLRGKQFFYDAADTRLALEGYISCAACHNDAGHDGRTWDFTGFGEGLRNTPTLRGHASQGTSHWTGNFDEIQDFEGQIRNFAGGSGLIANGTPNPPLGAPNAGRSADLDALAAYLQSLTVTGASPARTDAVSFSTAAVAGRAVFIAQNCASCHSGTQLTNSALNVFADIGTIKATTGRRLGAALTGLDVPTLRGLWATAPYLHDGSAATIADAVTAHRTVTLNATDLTNLVAYLASLDDDAAAPQRFADGGFELPKLGTGYLYNPTGAVWTFSTSSGVTANGSAFTAANPPAPGGQQVLFLQFSGSAQQSVTLAAGVYRLRMSAAQRGSHNTVAQTVIASVDGSEVGRITPAGANYAAHNTQSFNVAAGARLIRLAGLGKNADGTAASDTTAFIDELEILPAFSPGVSTPLAQSSVRGAAANLQIVASDPNGIALNYGASGLPKGLAINASTGLISGSVDASAAAANPVTVTVSNGALSASVSFAWATIAGNRAPAITAIAAQTAVRGASAALQVQAVDPDGQALTYAAGGLPAGLGINAAGLISGTVSLTAAATNAVTVTTSDGSLSASASFTWTTAAPPALPIVGRDIGAPGKAGSNSYAAGTYTVSGGGTDIWNTSDKFRYVSRTFTGNGEIIARVTSQTNTHVWAKAGIMFRETLNANSRFATMELTPGNGTTFQYRAATGGGCGHVGAAAAPAPNNWLRLVRAGNVFTGYRSTDGVNWTQVGSTTVPMATAITVGLAVTAHDNAKLGTATFDNVQIKP